MSDFAKEMLMMVNLLGMSVMTAIFVAELEERYKERKRYEAMMKKKKREKELKLKRDRAEFIRSILDNADNSEHFN